MKTSVLLNDNIIRHIYSNASSVEEFHTFRTENPSRIKIISLYESAIYMHNLELLKLCFEYYPSLFPYTVLRYNAIQNMQYDIYNWIIDNIVLDNNTTDGFSILREIVNEMFFNFIEKSYSTIDYMDILYKKYPNIINELIHLLCRCSGTVTRGVLIPKHVELMKYIHSNYPQLLDEHRNMLFNFYYHKQSYDGVSYILTHNPIPFEELENIHRVHSSCDIYILMVMKYNILPNEKNIIRLNQIAKIYQKLYFKKIWSHINDIH